MQRIYDKYKDRIAHISFSQQLTLKVIRLEIHIGGDYYVSVLNEYSTASEMYVQTYEFAIKWIGKEDWHLVYLDEYGDSVARYQTFEQVVEFIEKQIKEYEQ